MSAQFTPSDRPDQTDVAQNGKLCDSEWDLCHFLTQKNVLDNFLTFTVNFPLFSASV